LKLKFTFLSFTKKESQGLLAKLGIDNITMHKIKMYFIYSFSIS
jgi:hypothetical protein